MTSLFLAFAGSAALTACLLVLWVAGRMSRRAQHARLLRLEDEMAILQAGNIGLGKKLLALNRQVQGQGSAAAAGETIDAVPDRAQALSYAEVAVRSSAQTRSAMAGSKPARSHLQSVPTQPDTTPDDPFEPEFEQAQHLLSQGIGIAQVVQQTGLTRSEAELIQLLHPLAGSR